MVFILCFGHVLQGQEALRASLAGEAAAEAHKHELENTYYNLMLGPVKLRVAGGLSTEGTDNVNLSEKHPEADLSVSPRIDLTAFWRVTEQNALTLSAGIGYTTYLQHRELNHLFISPDTDLAFTIYAGNFLFTLHNRFQISQEATSQPQLSQTANYGFFQDDAGLAVNWDLNKAILTFSYDHEIQTFSPATFSYQDHASELFQLRAAWIFNPAMLAGLDLGGGLTTYDQHATNGASLSDLTSYNAGPFLESQLTEHISGKISGGYTVYSLARANSFGQSGSFPAYYAAVSIDHTVNAKLRYLLTCGRRIQLGIYSSTLDVLYARLDPTWKFIRKVDLRTPIYFEHAEQPGTLGEKLDRFGAGLEFTYQLTTKLTTGAGYHFLTKQSDLKGQNYIQNRLELDLRYSF